MPKLPTVYIMANKRNGTLYPGATSNLIKRVYEHKTGAHEQCFTNKYHCILLVYYEQCPTMQSAIEREKIIKGGSRTSKLNLIEKFNPEWHDLFDNINRW